MDTFAQCDQYIVGRTKNICVGYHTGVPPRVRDMRRLPPRGGRVVESDATAHGTHTFAKGCFTEHGFDLL